MKKRKDQRGFTLMELMVVIVIVAILAAVAVPLYINYVKDAQRTEAKGAIGAIITAEQAHFQRYGSYIDYADDDFKTPPAADVDRLNCDVTSAQNKWTFDVTNSSTTPPNFTVTAQEKGASGTPLKVTYILNPGTGQEQWKDE
jgi:prepilin-type N-terminal cleavage/methylation domain-containing protein